MEQTNKIHESSHLPQTFISGIKMGGNCVSKQASKMIILFHALVLLPALLNWVESHSLFIKFEDSWNRRRLSSCRINLIFISVLPLRFEIRCQSVNSSNWVKCCSYCKCTVSPKYCSVQNVSCLTSHYCVATLSGRASKGTGLRKAPVSTESHQEWQQTW